MGGGGRYPYPKYVWSPSGGWWVRPSNWASNTAIAAIGIIVVTAGVWNASSKIEQRIVQPGKQIHSMPWSKEQHEDKKENH